MSENRCHPGCMDGECTTQIQQHLASCSIEELQDELSELVLGNDDSDEALDLIDAYLAELEARLPCTTSISAEQSLADFHQKHEYLFTDNSPESGIAKATKPQRIRRYAILAATIGLLVCLFAVQAVGVNWMDALAKWTSDTFGLHFWKSEATISSNDQEAFADLRLILQENGVFEIKVPSFIPTGYELCELSVSEDGKIMSAGYEYEDTCIRIQIRKTESSKGSLIEKDTQNPTEYISNGIQCYVFKNIDNYVAAWNIGEYECFLFGVTTEEILYEMLDSLK